LDNASNNNTFVQELAIKLQSSNTKWDPDCLRFHCFSHILNLAAQAALSKVKEKVDKVINIICYILF